MLVKTVLTKANYWKYESEYRAIAQEREAGDREWQPKSHHGFVDVSPDALAGLILGAFMDPNEEALARGLLALAPHPMELWRARLEPERYELRIDKER
jgi:hypothetical protein